MRLELPQEQADFVRRAIEAGRFERPEDAVRDALNVWMNKEKFKKELLMISSIVKKMRDERDVTRIADLMALAIAELDLVTTDDPFRPFDEWDGEADRKAYADL